VAGAVRRCHGDPVLLTEVATRFGLGELAGPPVPVEGGLSNELWRVTTGRGAYAVKRMVTNAGRPGFVGNVEAAYEIEKRAWAAGVAMPEPVPDPATGRALALVAGSLIRVHRWIDGTAAAGPPAEATALLSTIHDAGQPRRGGVPEPPWNGDRWGPEIGGLARRVAGAPGRVRVVDSHRDLDPKNTLRRTDGVLLALDWDAAGPVCAVQEAVAVALDFSGGEAGAFGAALRAYGNGLPPLASWMFGGWVAAQGGWLDHQAARDGPEVATTLSRLGDLADRLDDLLVHGC
jgi:hypothetical protein